MNSFMNMGISTCRVYEIEPTFLCIQPLLLNTSISHHLTMSEYDEGTFRCTICAKEFLSKDEADKHFMDAHSGEKTNVME
jgi:hypothetical protein